MYVPFCMYLKQKMCTSEYECNYKNTESIQLFSAVTFYATEEYK